MKNALDSTSTRPYLIRALYDWCSDNGLTPYVAVMVDETVQVPREYVKDGEIVLNISFDATSALKLGNEYIEFKARFGGVARDIHVPVNRVLAIYARENGQGMAFPVAAGPAADASPTSAGPTPLSRLPAAGSGEAETAPPMQLVPADAPAESGDGTPPRPPAGGGARPSLKRVK
ncbi:MAG: ClpXP protease specificity-enhancing factor [Burkholderiaceae bacterium]